MISSIFLQSHDFTSLSSQIEFCVYMHYIFLMHSCVERYLRLLHFLVITEGELLEEDREPAGVRRDWEEKVGYQ